MAILINFSRRLPDTIRILTFILGLASVATLSLSQQATAQATKTYKVEIATGTVSEAATDADVHITFYGTQSRDGVKSLTDLDTSGYNDFQSGDRKTYDVSHTAAIGEIERIKLEHDDARANSGWYVDWVKVTDPVNNETIKFTLNRWLSKSDGDRMIEATVDRDDYRAWRVRYANKIPKPDGEWVVSCSGGPNCNSQINRSLDLGGSASQSWSNTVTNSLSVAVEKEAKFPLLGKAKITATGSTEQAKSQAGEEVKNRSRGYSESCGTSIDMQENIVGTVWQWSETTRIEGQSVVVKTCDTVCTATRNMPLFDPGDPRSIESCLASRKRFTQTLNSTLYGHDKEVLNMVSLGTCTRACEDRAWCKSLDYERQRGACYLKTIGGDAEMRKNNVRLSNNVNVDHYYKR